MIQRVQTLYLLIAAIFTGILLFLPMASFCGVVLAGDLTAWQIELTDAAGNTLIQPIHLLGILLLCAALLPLITIFLFRKRKLQMRLCLIEVCLLIASFGTFAYYYTQQNNDEMEKTVSPLLFLLIVAIASVLMARWRIAKDEALVRSLDRIR
mgnify:FL=1